MLVMMKDHNERFLIKYPSVHARLAAVRAGSSAASVRSTAALYDDTVGALVKVEMAQMNSIPFETEKDWQRSVETWQKDAVRLAGMYADRTTGTEAEETADEVLGRANATAAIMILIAEEIGWVCQGISDNRHLYLAEAWDQDGQFNQLTGMMTDEEEARGED